MYLKFELGRDLCTVHIATQFHHHTFNCSEIIVLTNIQTHAHTNKQIRSKISTLLLYATSVEIIYLSLKSIKYKLQ